MTKKLQAIAGIVLSAAIMCGAAAAEPAVRRCGWVDNPTPANWFLTDRDGVWILSLQGIHQADGFEKLPDLSRRDCVSIGRSGYGCACMTIEATSLAGTSAASVVKGKRVVDRLRDFEQQTLSTCRKDRRIKR